MPRAKRPLAEADPNAAAPAPKRSMPESTGNENEDYSKKTVVELSSLCKERTLKVTGKKGDLIARLEEFDAGKVAATSTKSKAWHSNALMATTAN
jgi:selenophosphate synthase